MAQTPIVNRQASLALTEYFPLTGVFPSRGGEGSGQTATNFFLGEIGLFAGGFVPDGASASGQIMSISQNTALFSLLGTFYGGNGVSNFALPNLNGTSLVGTGQGPGLSDEVIGEVDGSANVTLSYAQTPASIGGQGQAFDNHQPSLGITYEIAAFGVFPGGSAPLNSIGMVMPFAGSFEPGGYLACDGRLLQIADYNALYNVIGTTYGGNGITTFALPDLRGRDIIGSSPTTPIGTKVGAENVTLTSGQVPDGLGGAVTSFDNRQPSLAMEYMIALQGIFPTQGGGRGNDFTTPFLGEIMSFAGTFVPNGWALCNGALLSIAQNQALFSVLGTTYGGNGVTTFALPDLRDKAVLGTGNGVAFGTTVGTNSVTVTPNQLPDTPPLITSNGGPGTVRTTMVTSQTLVTTVTATDIDVGQTLAYVITGGEDQALFQFTNGNQLSFINAPNLSAVPSAGATAGYQVNIRVGDGFGGFSSQQITVYVSPTPHLSGGSVSYFDAIGGVYVDLSAQLGRRGDAGVSYLLGPANITPIATDQLSGVTNVTGSSFDDLFVGGPGADVFTGGLGADTFLFTAGTGPDIFTDFSHAQGDKIDLTSFPGIHNFTQVLYRSTQVNATDTVFDLLNGSQLTLKNISKASLVAGDFSLVPATAIESIGATNLAQVANTYYLDMPNGAPSPQLRVNGAPLMVGQIGAWTPIGAERVAGNYQVVLKNGLADQYVVWFTDSSGNYQTAGDQVSGSSWYVQGLEIPFGQDLNGDAQIGPVTTTIESIGATTLAKLADSFFLYNQGTTTGPQLKTNGKYASTGTLGAWTPIGAEQVAGNYQVVFKNGLADQYVVWFTDNNANYQTAGDQVSGASWLVQGLEIPFGQDLNGDALIGPVTTTIESIGATTLAKLADSFFLYNQGTTTGPQLKINGKYASTGTLGAWTPIGAEQIAGNYQVVFKNGLADQYVVWSTDSSGNYQTSTAQVTGASWLVQGLEIPFGQDLNGDAQIGPVTTNIESAGATTLAQVADSYFLYAHGTTSGPQLKQSGSYVVVGQSGTWTPLGVEVIQGGYQLVWKNTMAGADQYVTWNTDNSGNVVSSGAVMAGASPELKALEVAFGQDFNGNAVVGSSEPMMSMFGSGGADLALFTNYMASAFATPAGEGGAGGVDGQSSPPPPHLANPFA